MKKRMLLCLLVLCLLVSLAACGGGNEPAAERTDKESKPAEQSGNTAGNQGADSPNSVTEDDFSIVDLGDGTCKISACEATVRKLVVPDTIRGLKVVGIGDYAFNQCPAEEIVLPDTVEFIETNAFCLCEKLRRVELGSGLKRIGQLAFIGCDELERVDFPEGMTTLESFVFGACAKLGEVYIPASVTEIPMGIANITQCPNIVIVTPAGSTAEQAAKDNGLPVRNP